MAVLLAALFAAPSALAADLIEATLAIHPDRPVAVIAPEIYGQFAEHLGQGMYGGLWVGRKSPIPNTRGFRNDVVGALKALGVPVVRWPGGCFADQYHWRDGIGPRRPVRVNTTWGGVEESNAVGLHEYMDLMAQLGSKSYIDSNVGTGSPRETEDWLEYMTSPSHSQLADLRRRNGRAQPWHLDYWAFGNEPWGCGGTMRPEFYADLYHWYASFAKTPDGNRPKWIAAGGYGDDVAWTAALMASDAKAHQIDAITLHHFALPLGDFDGPKGPATGFGEDQWMSVMQRALSIDGMIAAHSAVMDRYDPQRKVALYVDEWSNWYDVEPGTNPGFLHQQNTLRDALTAAATLNIFHAHADRVRMACITQMVNVLQAMIHTDGPKMLLTPTYHVYAMYRPFRGATALGTELHTPDYTFGKDAVAAIQASAARTPDGRIVVALVNLDPHRAAHIAAAIPLMHMVTGSILTADAMDAHNSFDKPDVVKPAIFGGATLSGDNLAVIMPAKSLVVLELQ
ncbi:MAG: alpha-L-arabinofuranosidase C-terminal domain-containing protein [Rhizomicrobium sp.]